jgi:hypothetical protein
MRRTARFFILAVLLCARPPAHAAEVVTLATRAHVTQSYLLMYDKTAPPKAVAMLFPGGGGVITLPHDGRSPAFGPGANFLVRARDLIRDRELAVALLDAPSDQQTTGMRDAFRMGADHASDVAAVVLDLRQRFPGARIILIGTSRGTISAAYLARNLTEPVDAVVLTSAVFIGSRHWGSALSGFDYRTMKVPLLLVHHQDDGCSFCPYGEAQSLGETYPLITVRGGKPAQSGPCEPLSAHGYYGKEAETVAAIKAWIFGRPFPHLVE